MLRCYDPSVPDDLGALGWWLQINANHDVDQLFGVRGLALSEFYRILRGDTVIWYTSDDLGWDRVALLSLLFGGGHYGLWIRDGKRHGKLSRAFVRETLRLSLLRHPVLINTCAEAVIAGKTMRLGYELLGPIPHLFDGGDCYVLYLTRRGFERRWGSLDDYTIAGQDQKHTPERRPREDS